MEFNFWRISPVIFYFRRSLSRPMQQFAQTRRISAESFFTPPLLSYVLNENNESAFTLSDPLPRVPRFPCSVVRPRLRHLRRGASLQCCYLLGGTLSASRTAYREPSSCSRVRTCTYRIDWNQQRGRPSIPRTLRCAPRSSPAGDALLSYIESKRINSESVSQQDSDKPEEQQLKRRSVQ